MKMKYALTFLFVLFLFGTASESVGDPIVVGIKESPPFTMKTGDGSWTGITFDMWTRIAEANEIAFETRELPLTELLQAVKHGEVDVGMAALSITTEREAEFDFSHPYFASRLGIATTGRSVAARGGGYVDRMKPHVLEGILQSQTP